MKNYLLSAILFGFLSLAACKKNEPMLDYNACMQAESPSQEAIFTIIQGKWKLTELYCSFCNTPNQNLAGNYNQTLTFHTDSTVESTSDDIYFPPQKFDIIKSNGLSKRYTIRVNDPAGTYEIPGIFFTCGDKIGFSSAYWDGPTKIYTKQSK